MFNEGLKNLIRSLMFITSDFIYRRKVDLCSVYIISLLYH